jgi:hypothetical protein
MGTSVEPRKFLADALYEALSQLRKAFATENTGRDVGEFLQQLIVRHADEESLERILRDVKQELAHLSRQG